MRREEERCEKGREKRGTIQVGVTHLSFSVAAAVMAMRRTMRPILVGRRCQAEVPPFRAGAPQSKDKSSRQEPSTMGGMKIKASPREVREFAESVVEHKKDLGAVARSMGMDTTRAVQLYYDAFKLRKEAAEVGSTQCFPCSSPSWFEALAMLSSSSG